MNTLKIRVAHFEICTSTGCSWKTSLLQHLVINVHTVDLEEQNAVAISYGWGSYRRRKRFLDTTTPMTRCSSRCTWARNGKSPTSSSRCITFVQKTANLAGSTSSLSHRQTTTQSKSASLIFLISTALFTSSPYYLVPFASVSFRGRRWRAWIQPIVLAAGTTPAYSLILVVCGRDRNCNTRVICEQDGHRQRL